MDYYHRFTRSIFWELEDMIPFSNHPLYRTLWGWMGAPEVSLLKLAQGPVIRKASVYAHVVQESIMPVNNLAEAVHRFDEWYGVYPLLVFPLRVYDRGDKSGMLRPEKRNLKKGKDWGIWCDLGAYGMPTLSHPPHIYIYISHTASVCCIMPNTNLLTPVTGHHHWSPPSHLHTTPTTPFCF
jgi:hypothetical protein